MPVTVAVMRTVPSTGSGRWSSKACWAWTSRARAKAPGLRDQDAERRQHLLLDALAVLCGELEFLQRVAEPGPHPDRVEQRVLAVPGPLLRLARHSDQGVVKPHDNLRTRRNRPKLLERRSRTNSQPRPHPCQPALRP